MKEWISRPYNKYLNTYYVAKFSWFTFKGFVDKAKMEEWIENTKKKYSFNYEPEIKEFKKINTIKNNDGRMWDVYEEVNYVA